MRGRTQRTARGRALASSIATIVALGPGTGVALAAARAQPAPAAEPGPATAPDLGELWREAQAKLGTSDYAGAIGSLTQLYELVVHDPEAEALRQRVQWALHEAHVGAYGLEHDRAHLEIALDQLDKFAESLPAEDTTRQQEVADARAKVQALLDAHEDAAPEPEPTPEPQPQPEPEPAPEPMAPAPVDVPPADPGPDPSSRPLILGGAVLLGVGAVGTGLLIGGLASASVGVDTFETDPNQREDARGQIRTGNALGIAGGVIAGAFTVSGAVLLGLGLQRRHGRVEPMAWRTGGGLSWSGRF